MYNSSIEEYKSRSQALTHDPPHLLNPTKNCRTLELIRDSLKQGQNREFDLTLRKVSIESLLPRRMLKYLLKIG